MGGRAAKVADQSRPAPEAEGRAQAARAPVWRPAEGAGEVWLEALRWCALAVFVALPVVGFLAPPLAGRVVWTIVLPVVPLTIVLAGYHRWRQICPLAWFAQLAASLGRPGERRASAWLQANYYYVAFAVFFFSIWLRLVATNGHGPALAGFLLLLSLAAFAYGAALLRKWQDFFRVRRHSGGTTVRLLRGPSPKSVR